MKQTIHAKQVLTSDGWVENLSVSIDPDGTISALRHGSPEASDEIVDVLLPGMANVHSHSFQRAMAGLTEHRSARNKDDFWSWRELMYRFLAHLSPDDIQSIAAQVQLESLEAGFTSIGEFHYLHHQIDGKPYADISEISARLFDAANQTGIGFTHLPVLYMRGGFDDRPLTEEQGRFRCSIDQFSSLFEKSKSALTDLPQDFTLGVAPHSLRAVNKEALSSAIALCTDGPVHIHIAEQTAEVEDAKEALGARPVEWLANNVVLDDKWCLVHATHMNADEIKSITTSNASVGLCPITEANLGDGIFSAPEFIRAGGNFCVGSDSNIRISLTEELRLLEYSQRLHNRRRNVLAGVNGSCGRFLYQHAAQTGARAIGRNAGEIATGFFADLISLKTGGTELEGLVGNQILDSWIFAHDDRFVDNVWSAGRHVVRNGRHKDRDTIRNNFLSVIQNLRKSL
ncbi:formimidoylglutamate deiminase [Hyphococcus sp. DH-69]|uniref:formimidoylglutamate deiminase n=1 Tax=Hyphococcus formosus TaxID=3143534 RepID=UPI00398B43F9